MGIYISKYEFNSQEASAETKINALPSATDEDGNDAILLISILSLSLGNIVIELKVSMMRMVNETTAPVLSENYHVDVLWKDIRRELMKMEIVTVRPPLWMEASYAT